MALAEYKRKRDFTRTAEPAGQVGKRGRHRFAIHKHAATRLHYDFRLELDGVLKSWAVPRGIPLGKGEKRLAVRVEDHPVSYMDFEGTIPKGEYGGGTVMVWDIGTYEPLSKAPAKDLAQGKLHFTLSGRKLEGEWYLVRLKGGDEWLLIRAGGDLELPARADDLSALSGRTMDQLSRGDRVWHSPRAANGKPGRAARLPPFIEPMKALTVDEPPARGDWLYEIKFDGFRALALKNGRTVRLMSRNEKDFSGKFPELVDALGEIPGPDAVIDGEIVALDGKGRSSFQLLQAYDLGQERSPIYFYAFDLLLLGGRDLRKRKVAERKAALRDLLGEDEGGGLVRFSAAVGTDPEPLLGQVRSLGLEGLIGKRVDSIYESGRRSGAWIKLKVHQQQEFIIGGFTPPEGTRHHFGALLVGIREGRKLRLAGKVGTGFNHKLLRSLYDRMKALETGDCPFDGLPEKRRGRYGQGITAAEMKRCRWVRPQLVCQVRFSEWTRDDRLRHPVFLGLREDKDASEVVREKHA